MLTTTNHVREKCFWANNAFAANVRGEVVIRSGEGFEESSMVVAETI